MDIKICGKCNWRTRGGFCSYHGNETATIGTCLEFTKITQLPKSNVLNVSYEEVDRLCDLIVKQIEGSHRIFLDIVTVAYGGIIPSAILGYKLGINQIHIIHKPIKTPFMFTPTMLFCDDCVDLGSTLNAVISMANMRPAIATLYYKPTSTIIPNYYGDETLKWIQFPWEHINAGGRI